MKRKIRMLGALLLALVFTAGLGQAASTSPKDRAASLLDALDDAPLVGEEDNRMGLSVRKIEKAPEGEDYLVWWSASNDMVLNNGGNAALVLSKMTFIDPEDYENTYQAFTLEDGQLSRAFEEGDEISNFFMRMKLVPQSGVVYLAFDGATVEEGAPEQLHTIPLFFTLVLGESPEVYEAQPRASQGRFDEKGR